MAEEIKSFASIAVIWVKTSVIADVCLVNSFRPDWVECFDEPFPVIVSCTVATFVVSAVKLVTILCVDRDSVVWIVERCRHVVSVDHSPLHFPVIYCTVNGLAMAAVEFSADSHTVRTYSMETLIVVRTADIFGQIRAFPVIDYNFVSAMWINIFEHDVR